VVLYVGIASLVSGPICWHCYTGEWSLYVGIVILVECSLYVGIAILVSVPYMLGLLHW